MNLIHPEQQKDDSEGGVDNLGLGGEDDNGMEEDDERLLLDQTDDDELNHTEGPENEEDILSDQPDMTGRRNYRRVK